MWFTRPSFLVSARKMAVLVSPHSIPDFLKVMQLHVGNVKSDSDLQVFAQIKNITQHHDESFYVCNLNDVVEKHKIWKKNLPGIQTFYGKLVVLLI